MVGGHPKKTTHTRERTTDSGHRVVFPPCQCCQLSCNLVNTNTYRRWLRSLHSTGHGRDSVTASAVYDALFTSKGLGTTKCR